MTTLTQNELTILSFGGGQDSTALLYKLAFDSDFRATYAPGRLLVLMSDTGDEHQTTKDHVAKIKIFCQDQGIEFYLITSDMGFHIESWMDYRSAMKKTSSIMISSGKRKSCTDNLKIQPIYKFVEKWLGRNYGFKSGLKKAMKSFTQKFGQINVMIGIARGEEKRVAKKGSAMNPKWFNETINIIYPLIDLGMDRQACQDYIKSVGMEVPTPSNCILCPFMSKQEMVWLDRFDPASFQDWISMEDAKLAKWEGRTAKNEGVFGKKLLPQKMAEAIAEFGHLTDEQLNDYKMSHGHCVKSIY